MNQEELVTAFKRHDPRAVEQLVDSYGDRLVRSAFLLCGNETEAQDMVQETFLEAIRSVQRFQGRSSIHTWLHAILLNVARHHQRKQKRMVYDNDLVAGEISSPEPSLSSMDARTAASALQGALGRLSEAHREVIVLRYYEDMKIHEIAGCLGISKGTVKSRLHYAIGEIQKILPGELNLFGAGDTEKVPMQ
jgi:RNA polymerase sigma-70 factor (ECF subfamily)